MSKFTNVGKFIWNNKEYEFNYKESLTSTEKQVFFDTACNIIYPDDSCSAKAFLRDLGFNMVAINVYTDIDIKNILNIDSNSDNSDDLDNIEEFIETIDIMNFLKSNVMDNSLDEVYDEITYSIYGSIYGKENYDSPADRLVDTICRLVDTLAHKVGDTNIDGEQLTQFVGKFNSMSENFNMNELLKVYTENKTYKK